MSADQLIRIAARKSDLARLQAYEVGHALQKAHTQLKIEYLFSSSLGDVNLIDPLWKMPEKGVFTADLTAKLQAGECDIVVHSWKDLPTEPNPGTEIAATLERADIRDVILFKKKSVLEFKNTIKIFSSSPRRAYNLTAFLKWSLPKGFGRHVNFESVRGNMATRAQKYLADETIDGWVVAKAAFDRLLSSTNKEFSESQSVLRQALEVSHFQVVPITASPAAPAQGALAIEVRRDNVKVMKLLEAIHHLPTWQDVNAERELFRKYGGGCHQKIGLTYITKPYGQIQVGRGTHADEDFFFMKLRPVPSAPQFPHTIADFVYQGVTLKPQERTPLAVDSKLLQNKDLFVARADAWPDKFKTTPLQIVWTSGTKTWRKLADLGIWVTGTQDSLGEQEPIQLKALLGRTPDFVKLTHSQGFDGHPNLPVVGTYEVTDAITQDDLRSKTHFYWMSFSQYQRAEKLNADVRGGYHACGPGNTFTLLSAHLKKTVGDASKLRIYLSREMWLEDILKR